jgi:hypothetical protein
MPLSTTVCEQKKDGDDDKLHSSCIGKCKALKQQRMVRTREQSNKIQTHLLEV